MGSSQNPTAPEARTGRDPGRETGRGSGHRDVKNPAGATGHAVAKETTGTAAVSGTGTMRTDTVTKSGSTAADTDHHENSEKKLCAGI